MLILIVNFYVSVENQALLRQDRKALINYSEPDDEIRKFNPRQFLKGVVKTRVIKPVLPIIVFYTEEEKQK